MFKEEVNKVTLPFIVIKTSIFFWFIKLSIFIQVKKVEILKVFGSDQEALVPFIFKEKTVLFSLISLLSRNEKF